MFSICSKHGTKSEYVCTIFNHVHDPQPLARANTTPILICLVSTQIIAVLVMNPGSLVHTIALTSRQQGMY